MKIALWVSGIVGALILTLLLTGWADADDSAKKALREGNLHYSAAEYAQALAAYETGLGASPENKALIFNAAQAAYMLGAYDKAALYYEQSDDSIEKFLNGGNIYFRVGDAVEDEEAKVQCYLQALLIYQEGIVKFPRNVPLKYNFERVMEKLELLQEDMEQEGEGEDGEEGEDQGESEGQSADNSDQDDQEQSEADQSESGEGEEQETESSESAGEGEEENAAQGDDGDQEQDEDQQSAYNQEEAEYEQDRQAIERILEVLESQEEEDLKNNQSVVRGKEGKNGW